MARVRDLPQRRRRAGGVAVDAVERLVRVSAHPADEQDVARCDPRHEVGEVGRGPVVGEDRAAAVSPSQSARSTAAAPAALRHVLLLGSRP